MSLENPTIEFKLKALLATKTKEHLLKIIQDYNNYCKANALPENILKGYSKKPYNTKEGLIDFLLERLSDEEKEGILNKVEAPYLEELFKAAQKYYRGEAPREKLDSLSLTSNTLKMKFKGWQWENDTEIELEDDGTLTNYICTCRTGKMDGFCVHMITGITALLKKGRLNQEKFLFEIPPTSQKAIEKLNIDFKDYIDVDKTSADIVLGNDYFISVDGNLVTLKWGGDRAGKTTKDITTEKKPIPVEMWVAKKVVDKILAPLKDHPDPREVVKDGFGVVPIILEDEKLVTKILKRFKKKNEADNANLPTTKEELDQFLNINL